MRTRTVVAILAAVLLMGLASFGALAPAAGAQSSSADAGRRLVSVTGQSTTRPGLLVDVILAVPAGRNVEQAAADALRAQGARPVTAAYLGSDGFTLNNVSWPGPTTQYYNPTGQEVSNGESLLTDAQLAWTAVADSTFEVTTAGTTTRCPSLVKECPGRQVTDDTNDVGWLRLKGSSNVLGVAWSVTSGPEVDIALNTAAAGWDQDDLTLGVLLHEEGHFGGLGHSGDSGAVMYRYIADPPLAALTADDAEGITYLYPTKTLDVEGKVTTDGTNAIAGATVQLVGTPYSATTGANGTYTLRSVPAPVTYDIRASGDGVVTTYRDQISSGHTTFDFILAPTEQDSGGPSHCSNPANANHPSCRKR